MKKFFMMVVLCVSAILFVGCNNSEKEASEAADKAISFNQKMMNNALKSVDEEMEEVKNYDIDKEVEDRREELKNQKNYMSERGYEKEKKKIDGIKKTYQNTKLPEKIEKLEDEKQSYEDDIFQREKSNILVYEDDNNYYVYLRKNIDDDVYGKSIIGDGFKINKESEKVDSQPEDRKKIVEFYSDNEEPVLEEKNVELVEDTIEMR